MTLPVVIGGIVLVGIILYLALQNRRLRRRLHALEHPYPTSEVPQTPPSPTSETAPVQAGPEDMFLTRLHAAMEKHMSNNTLTVEQLVDEMGMGRTVFFNKLKNATGLSPVEFIREMRIKRAAQLLGEQQYNITEVTYMVGMNDSRYFAKCFKNTYGITPSEYRGKVKEEK